MGQCGHPKYQTIGITLCGTDSWKAQTCMLKQLPACFKVKKKMVSILLPRNYNLAING